MNHGWLNKENHIEFIKHSLEKFLSSSLNLLPSEQNTNQNFDVVGYNEGYYSYIGQSFKEMPICYWEQFIHPEQMNLLNLKDSVNHFYSFLKRLENDLHASKSFLPKEIISIELTNLEKLYPEHSYHQAIRAITQKYGAVFLVEHVSGKMFVWDCIREDSVKLASLELLANSDVFFDTYRLVLSEHHPQVIRAKVDLQSLVGLLTHLNDFKDYIAFKPNEFSHQV